MNALRKLTSILAIAALTLTVGAMTPAFAQGHNSGGHAAGGGGHAAGGGGHATGGGGHAHYGGGGGRFASRYAGGFHGGGFYGSRGGFYGRGGYGRGGYGRGGYGHGGFYGPGFGFGWFLPVLPALYATYYWGGIPYYYANDAYYTWNPDYNGYVATDPPAGADGAPDAGGQAPAAAPGGQTYNYPKNGQTEEQQSADRYQCHQWAVSQSGYDPTRTSAPTTGGQQFDYRRALTACLEGRGYSVK
jgi:hypothetical protein